MCCGTLTPGAGVVVAEAGLEIVSSVGKRAVARMQPLLRADLKRMFGWSSLGLSIRKCEPVLHKDSLSRSGIYQLYLLDS